jgi:hypothetical protein
VHAILASLLIWVNALINIFKNNKGIFEIDKENYKSTKSSLETLLAKIKPLKETGIDINQINYRIEFRLGCDLLFLANMLGIKMANSSHPCPWCTVNIKRTVSSNMPTSYRTNEEAFRIIILIR